MRARRAAVLAVTGAVVAGGAGVAIGSTTGFGGKEAEQSVLDDAAKRLGTSADKLREALSAAEDAQLDQAVKDGDLTQEEADRIKEARRQSGRVLGGPGLHRGFERFGPLGAIRGFVTGVADDVAKALGITRDQLVDQLRDGRSIEAIAKANGKTLGDIKAAANASAKARLDKAVQDGALTRAQADDLLARIRERVDHLDELGTFGGHRGPGVPGGPFGPRFGFEVRGDLFEDVAKAIGITPAQLGRQLRDGRSVEDVAKANGKTLDQVRDAAVAAEKARLDKAVQDGDLTREQADELLEHAREHIARLADARAFGPRRGPFGHGPGHWS